MQTTLTSQTPAVVYLASLLDCGRAISITRQHVYPVFSVPVRVRGEKEPTRRSARWKHPGCFYARPALLESGDLP